MNNEWIYSAVIISILVGVAGFVVGAKVVRRVSATSLLPLPVLVWLLVAMAFQSLAMAIEQSRVLLFRLSLDGWVGREWFGWLYDLTIIIAGSKVLAFVSVAGAFALALALVRGHEDAVALRWGAVTGWATGIAWLLLALLLHPLFGD